MAAHSDYILDVSLSLSASDLIFPVNGNGWSETDGSPFHRNINYAGHSFDDSHAYDLNLNQPSYDTDDGLAVRPVSDGTVIVTNAALGFVLIEHDTPLTLDNGETLDTWYSGYMHMENIVDANEEVTTATTLGNISDTGARNNHLHFAIYELVNETYESIDIEDQLEDLSEHIDFWF